MGIVGILLTLTVPLLASTRSRARAVSSLSNIRQIGGILSLYADANRDLLPTLYEPVLTTGDDYQTVETPQGATLFGTWFNNAQHYQFALDSTLPAEIRLDPRRPKGDSTIFTNDYSIGECFYASHDYWDRYTQRGPEQWRTQRLGSVAFPAQKGFVRQSMVFDVPGFDTGYPACCIHDIKSAVLWADHSAQELVQGELILGVPNFYRHPESDSPMIWSNGPPIDNTQDGVLGRDR